MDYPNAGSLDLGEFNNGAVVVLPSFPESDTGFPAILATQEVTISFWMNRLGALSTDQITFDFNAGPGDNRQLRSHAPWSNGNLYFDVAGCCGGNQRINAAMGGPESDSEWHHMLYIKKKNPDESEKAITAVFIDGTPLISSPGCDVDCWANGATDDVDWAAATIDDVIPITGAAIGAAAGGGNSQNGLMDEFAIWNEALSIVRIEELAAGGPVLLGDQPDPGDFNMDGVIDLADWSIMLTNFNGPGTAETGDVNFDRKVNFRDFIAFRELYAAANPAGAAAVPEPSSLLLLAFAGLLSLGLRRRPAR